MDGKDAPFTVAVIGGGIGGATTTHYLRSLFGKQVSISVFEKSGRVGGRMRSLMFLGTRQEMGASIFHSCNHYVKTFATILGLTVNVSAEQDSRVLFYRGTHDQGFTTIGGPSFLVPFRMLWHYGLDLLRVRYYTQTIMNDLGRIYKLQDSGHSYSTTAKILTAMSPEFVEMTSTTYESWLTNRLRIGKRFRDDIAYGLLAANYCQNLGVHAFVGMVSMATMNPKLLVVKEGVEEIPKLLIKHALNDNPSNAPKDITHAAVDYIRPVNKDNGYIVGYTTPDSTSTTEKRFDYVILAAPMHQESRLKLPDKTKLPMHIFHVVDRSLFCGQLKEFKFNLPPGVNRMDAAVSVIPNENSCISNSKAPFLSMCSQMPNTNKRAECPSHIWNVFSTPNRAPDPLRQLGEEYLDFPEESCSDNSRVSFRWHAFPLYKPLENPEEELGKFELAPRLYYINAIEQAASCMEMSAIGGRNVALLLAAHRNPGCKDYKLDATS